MPTKRCWYGLLFSIIAAIAFNYMLLVEGASFSYTIGDFFTWIGIAGICGFVSAWAFPKLGEKVVGIRDKLKGPTALIVVVLLFILIILITTIVVEWYMDGNYYFSRPIDYGVMTGILGGLFGLVVDE